MLYVLHGELVVNGKLFNNNTAEYVEDHANLQAGSEGAMIWRWTITRESDGQLALLQGNGITSTLCLSRRVKMFEMVPTSKWLFRLDTIIGFEGSTGLHSHPGSGIRCILDGHLRTESEKGENTDNSREGDVRCEEGAYPLISTVDPGKSTTFLRGMILPPEFAKYHETATWIEGTKATLKEWRVSAESGYNPLANSQ